MKIIDAHWELRNLGLSTQEVEIESEDTLEEVKQALSSLTANYQVVKVPVADLNLSSLLSSYGFSFAEAMIRVSHSLKELSCSSLIKRISDQITFEEMSNDETEIMHQQIKNGMFQTDRVILDPIFSPSQAANRYILWMKDEKERGSVLYTYKYKGQPVGFSCMREINPQVYYPVLGGIYSQGKALPFGSAIIYKQLEIAKRLGGKQLVTYISTNNPGVIRAYSQLGYVFEDIKYVFVKHFSIKDV